MSLLSLIAVLLIEQVRPLPYRLFVFDPLSRLATFLETRFNAGAHAHGALAWCLGTGALVLLAGVVHALLYRLTPLLAWVWSVFVLYLTMGFRQFSHYYTDIQFALRMGDEAHAGALLAEWRGQPTDNLRAEQIAALSIEQALAASHRHVFGALLCFVILPGPCGAVLYRAAAVFAEVWGRNMATREDQAFAVFSRKAFTVIDWLPLRVTATSFAIVGNFEDALYSWRTRAGAWAGEGLGIVLSSGAGALGVRLGETGRDAESGGAEANVDFMQSTVALIWRALWLWVLLLLLAGVAGLVG